MKAIILAAGRGSRLKKLTSGIPKCLNEVGGTPLIMWQINALRKAGVDDIVIVTGYKAQLLGDFGARTLHNDTWSTTNMVQSLVLAEGEIDSPTIVSYSDIIYSHIIVTRLIESHEHEDVVLAYDTDWQQLWKQRFTDPLSDAESFKKDRDNRILELGRPVDNLEDIEGQYMGLMRFSPAAISWIVETLSQIGDKAKTIDMTSIIQMLINSGKQVFGVQAKGRWCEIDTESDLALANLLFKKGVLEG